MRAKTNLLMRVLTICLLAACTAPPVASPSPVASTTPAVTAAASVTAAWYGVYYRLADSSQQPMASGGRLQLVLAQGAIPGRVLRPELTWWGANVPLWSPDGTRALLRDRDLKTYVVTRAGSVSELTSAWGEWRWRTDDELISVHDQPGKPISESKRVLARLDARTGQSLGEVEVPPIEGGLVSPDGRWIAFGSSGPHRPLPLYAFEIATLRLVKLSDGAVPGGWLADGRLVLALDAGGVEAVAPDGSRRERIFDSYGQVLAQPHARAAIVVDRDGAVWSVVPGSVAVRSPATSPLRGQLHTISSDGRWISFTEALAATFPAVGSERAGVLNLSTGAVNYACEKECRWLAVR